MKVLVIDNIDSFTYNLVQYLGEEGVEPLVLENSASLQEIERLIKEERIERIIISPGPKDPKGAGISNEVIRKYAGKLPILGVCLGHQCIGYVFGGRIRHAKSLKHGKTSMVSHHRESIFKGVKNPFKAVRYHSLVIDDESLPDCLKVCAISNDDKEIMAVKHNEYDIYGIQFHPESMLTLEGRKIIRNFLDI